MKHNASTLGRRAAAAAGVLTLAVLGLAPMAQAENANYGNIKADASGSLTIHKHIIGDGNPIGTPAGASVTNGSKGDPVPGVVFTAYPITDINLKDPAGWDTISNLAKAGVPTAPAPTPPPPRWGRTSSAPAWPLRRPMMRVSPRFRTCRSRPTSCVRPRPPVTSSRRPSPSW